MRILLIALLTGAVLPAGANAATVSRSGGTLDYAAGNGELISGSLTETAGGAFLVRHAKRQRLSAGAGCKRTHLRQVRCPGQGVERVAISFTRARRTSLTLRDVRVPLAAQGSRGGDFVLVRRTPDFTYDGGPGGDSVVDADTPAGHHTLRLGAGSDSFYGTPLRFGPAPAFTVDGGPGTDHLVGGPGADALAGGSGRDELEGGGGADMLAGGSGTDTAVFGSLIPQPVDNGPISVTLDGLRNDGTAGENALVGADVENATIRFLAPPGGGVLVGNEGPNVLVGPGAVSGLGGNDIVVTDNSSPQATTLDGGEGDDRIGARAEFSDGGFADTTANVVCGPGADVVFTNAAVPADCEAANVGMHVRGAQPIRRNGVVRARIDCTDPRGCLLGGLLLKLRGHLIGASVVRTPAIRIPFGDSRTARVRIKARVWKRHRRDRSLRVQVTPAPEPTRIASPAASTGSYPRTLTLRIRR